MKELFYLLVSEILSVSMKNSLALKFELDLTIEVRKRPFFALNIKQPIVFITAILTTGYNSMLLLILFMKLISLLTSLLLIQHNSSEKM